MKNFLFALFALVITPLSTFAQAPGQVPDKFGKTYSDNAYVRYGNAQDAICGYNTTQTADSLVCGLSTDSEALILMQKADIGVNMELSDFGTPTLVIANSDPTKYMLIYHDGTNPVISSNTGSLSIGGNLSLTSSLVFEGATANDFETTLVVTDPTADRTVTFADASGTVMLSALATNAVDVANSVTGASSALVFEGATADGFETSLTLTDPTADRTVTMPDAGGTVILGGNTSIAAGANVACNTTCGAANRCIAGQDADAANVLVACNSAAADVCICSAN